jgi:putative aldouronate transport system permease protein
VKEGINMRIQKELRGWNIFDYLNIIFMLLILVLCLYPFVFVIAGAFNEGNDYMRGGVYLFPRKWSLDNFTMVFNDKRLLIGFKNTVGRTTIGTITGTLFTSFVAYGMSRKDLPCRNLFYWFSIFTMFFGGGLVPFYLILKSLNLINSFWVYILPQLYSVFNMIIFVNFYKEIPEEIHEAGLIDGAKELQIYQKLYLPLSIPVITTVAMWVGVGHWNSFFDSMVFTSDANLQTLQLFLVKLIKEAAMAQGEAATKVPSQVLRTVSITTIRYAAIVISTLPVILVYPFIQKHLAKGVIVGSIKG